MLGGMLHGRRIYIDETGFNLYTRRSYVRAPVGERVNRIVGGQRGRNVTFLVAVTPDVGVVHFESFQRGVNQDDVAEFVTTLSTLLGEEQATLLMDNAPSHRNLQPPAPHHPVMFIPPYSPFLNPIENCFSVLKSSAKQRLALIQGIVDDRALARENGMGLMQWRNHVLIREVTAAMVSVTAQVVAANFRHAYGFLAQCLREEPILE